MKILHKLKHWCQIIYTNGNIKEKKKKICQVYQVKLWNNTKLLTALSRKFNSFNLKKEELKAECSPKHHSYLLWVLWQSNVFADLWHTNRKHPRYLLPNTWKVDFGSNIERPKLKVSRIPLHLWYPQGCSSLSTASQLCFTLLVIRVFADPALLPDPVLWGFQAQHTLLPQAAGKSGTLWHKLPW